MYVIIVQSIFKDIDGKYANFKRYRESADGASRYVRFWYSPSRVGLVKAKASNKTRGLPLQSEALFEAVERFPFPGGNQGGTANFSSLNR